MFARRDLAYRHVTPRKKPLASFDFRDYRENGFAIYRERDRAYGDALFWHCAGERLPLLVVSKRRAYCSFRLDLDTLARPVHLPEDVPFAKWVKEATESVPQHADWEDIAFDNASFVVHKVPFKQALRLAMRIAEYLQEHGIWPRAPSG